MIVHLIAKKFSGHICRPACGVCDADENCDGYDNDCPKDIKKPNTTLCRIANGECDKSEFCTGDSNNCPPNKFRKENFPCFAKECNEREKCTTEDYCNGRGECIPGKSVCPEPAIKEATTFYKQYNPSGKVNAYTATVNGEESVIIQWKGYTDFKAKGAHLYIGTTKPTSTEPSSYPYAFTSSTPSNKFQMVVSIKSINYTSTCNSQFFIALEINTLAGNNAACGLKNKELDYCQNTEGSSWMQGESISSDCNYGASYSKVKFCCCFDSKYSYDPVEYKTMTYATQEIIVYK